MSKIVAILGAAGVYKTTTIGMLLDAGYRGGVINIEGDNTSDVLKSHLKSLGNLYYEVGNWEEYRPAFRALMENPKVQFIASDSITCLCDELMYQTYTPFIGKDGGEANQRERQDAYGKMGYRIAQNILFSRILAARKANKMLVDIYHSSEMFMGEGVPPKHVAKLQGNMARQDFARKYNFILHLVAGLGGKYQVITRPDDQHEAKAKFDYKVDLAEHPDKFAHAEIAGYFKRWIEPPRGK